MNAAQLVNPTLTDGLSVLVEVKVRQIHLVQPDSVPLRRQDKDHSLVFDNLDLLDASLYPEILLFNLLVMLLEVGALEPLLVFLELLDSDQL